MAFRVLKEGIQQKVDGVWRSPKVGEVIELSDTAADYLTREGYVEGEDAPRGISPSAEQPSEAPGLDDEENVDLAVLDEAALKDGGE